MNHTEAVARELVRWIEDNIHHPLKIDDIAQKSGYSRWHLQRLFREHQGETLGSYIRRRRLQRAAEELLEWEGMIEDLALKYGYDSVHTFCRVFKQSFGLPPGAWRAYYRYCSD